MGESVELNISSRKLCPEVAQTKSRVDICDQMGVAVQGKIKPEISHQPTFGPGVQGMGIEMKVHSHVHKAIRVKPEGSTIVSQLVSGGGISFSTPAVTFLANFQNSRMLSCLSGVCLCCAVFFLVILMQRG